MRIKRLLLKKFKSLFWNFGGYGYDNPLKLIAFALLVAAIFSVFFFFIEFENRADVLYAMPSSQSRSDLAKQAAIFGRFPRINMLFVLSADDSNVLTAERLRKIENLVNYITTELKVPGYENMTYQNICYKQKMQFGSPDSMTCSIRTALDFYRSSSNYGQQITTRRWPYVVNLQKNKITKADLSLIKPEVIEMESGITRIKKASGLILLFETSNDQKLANLSYAWEAELIKFINNILKKTTADRRYYKPTKLTKLERIADKFGIKTVDELDKYSSNSPVFNDTDWHEFNIIINAQRSWQDELSRTTRFDVRLIFDYICSFIIVLFYMLIVNLTSNFIRSKGICGIFGAISALLGVIVGAGICYSLGLQHAPTMHATPFLVIAIGLDNTFVILNFYSLAFTMTKNPKIRCQHALADSGIALFITTITSIVSFAIGAVGPYVAVRNFCIVTSMGLLGGFIYNIIFFYPILCLEAKSEANSRIWFISEKLFNKLARTKFILKSDLNNNIDTNSISDSSSSNSMLLNQNNVEHNNSAENGKKVDTNFDGTEISLEELSLRSPKVHIKRTHFNETTDRLRAAYINDRSMFEVVTIQWSLTKLRNLINNEINSRSTILSNEYNAMNVQNYSETNNDNSNHEHLQNNSDANNFVVDNNFIDKFILDYETTKNELKELSNTNLLNLNNAIRKALHVVEEPAGNKGKKSRKFILKYLGPCVHNDTLLSLILFIMSLYILISIYFSLRYLSAGLNLDNLTPPNSYLREAFELSHTKIKLFAQQTNVVFTAPKTISGHLYLTKSRFTMPKISISSADNDQNSTFINGVDNIYGIMSNNTINKTNNVNIQQENNFDEDLVFTSKEVLDNFDSNNYGKRNKNVDPKDITGISASNENMTKYLNSLGELYFWEKNSIKALLEFDYELRLMQDTQDVLNGMALFLQDHVDEIVKQPTFEERRKKFYNLLAKWLRMGIVGRHVREHFYFNTDDNINGVTNDEDGSYIPPLESFRLVIFHYNFLNSYTQSKYMLQLRKITKTYNEKWSDYLIDKSNQKHYAEINLDMRSLQEVTTEEQMLRYILSNKFNKFYNSLRGLGSDSNSSNSSFNLNDNNALKFKEGDAPYPNYTSLFTKANITSTNPNNRSLFTSFGFMETFLYFETDIHIWSTTFYSMVSAFFSIIFASCLFLEGLDSLLLVVLMIISVDLGVFGFMAYFGLHLNILTMILLILSIGLSVDYTVHVVHTYSHTLSSNSKDRTVETLILICNPITHGALSTLLAIMPIYFRNYYVLLTFFYMTALVIVFGFLNGAVFLPVVLAKYGNMYTKKNTKNTSVYYLIKKIVQGELENDILTRNPHLTQKM